MLLTHSPTFMSMLESVGLKACKAIYQAQVWHQLWKMLGTHFDFLLTLTGNVWKPVWCSYSYCFVYISSIHFLSQFSICLYLKVPSVQFCHRNVSWHKGATLTPLPPPSHACHIRFASCCHVQQREQQGYNQGRARPTKAEQGRPTIVQN